MRAMLRSIARFVVAVLVVPVAAALPPDLLNYQGVLRDAAGEPLDGSFDMVFRFVEAVSGDEILVDRHNGPIPVTVTGGLFNVSLGGGVVNDGTGPGTYTALSQVFRDVGNVLLRVEVNGEILSPDVRVLSAGYAHNATYLNGVFESQFLRSDENDTAVGKLYFAGNPSGSGISQGTVFISPTAADPNDTLLGVAFNASERFKVDAEGDTTVQGGLTVADELFVNPALPFVGVGRSSRVTGAEAFGVSKTTAAGQFGGMYINTTHGSGWPFYGYATNGTGRAWHYVDGATGAWKLVNNGLLSMTVDSGGNVGIGTAVPGQFGLRVENGPGYFSSASTEEVILADIGYGIQGFGTNAGGYFQDGTSLNYAYVGSDIYKIHGPGTVSFMQNHPEDPSSVIFYAAPEGDEIATYTRGSGRLADGVARVVLGPTFRWVTNPDIGLTAQVTPRAEPAVLWVESVSTSELVVRGPAGSSAAFDYAVWGLRIGFEEAGIVQERAQPAPIPSMTEHRELYVRRPELRRFNALARFEEMAGARADAATLDRARSRALLAAIGEAEPQVEERRGPSRPDTRGSGTLGMAGSRTAVAPDKAPATPAGASEGGRPRLEERALGSTAPLLAEVHPVSEPVAAGDVLVVDPDHPGTLRSGRHRADPKVVGVAVGPATSLEDGTWQARVASFGVVTVRADAGYGAIRPGDLLTSSPTPGHVMRAIETLPGSLAGKALDGLDVGTGTIRIVVSLR